MEQFIKQAAMITPSPRQLAWQEMEFYAFLHFGVNTFTNREWGLGTEEPGIFDPEALDADQWVAACKAAGMAGLILTCKHHDGFCLWPSRLTEHSVQHSPWKRGRGDVVREVSEACRRGGLKFGVYLSPWDRHERCYGDSAAYNAFFVGQLTELLTQYGPVFCLWLDGACGEGPNGKRQVYDWDAYYATVRALQPEAVISVCGPDVRWCGNEAGHCRASEWSVVPAKLMDLEKIQEKSQQADSDEFRRRVSSSDEDLGSREAIQLAERLAWYPAEVNTSIRPGWFYHREEDGQVKPLDELLKIYYASVGGNAAFLLNIPPDRRGLIHQADAARLAELGETLRRTFSHDLAQGAAASDTADGAHAPHNILNDDRNSYWRPSEGIEEASVTLQFEGPKTFDTVVLMEHIASGQRIEEFALDYDDGGAWRELFRGTVVGYKRICHVRETTSTALRLRITKSRWQPTLSHIGMFHSKA